MRSSAKSWIEPGLLALAVALAALWLVPRPVRPLPEPAPKTAGAAAESAAPEKRQPGARAEVEVEAVAALFGWARKAPPPAPAPPPSPAEKPPEEAGWLKATGFVVSQDGGRSYIFKDNRSGNVLSIPLGKRVQGWLLLEANAGGPYLLEYEGKRYIAR